MVRSKVKKAGPLIFEDLKFKATYARHPKRDVYEKKLKSIILGNGKTK